MRFDGCGLQSRISIEIFCLLLSISTSGLTLVFRFGFSILTDEQTVSLRSRDESHFHVECRGGKACKLNRLSQLASVVRESQRIPIVVNNVNRSAKFTNLYVDEDIISF